MIKKPKTAEAPFKTVQSGTKKRAHEDINIMDTNFPNTLSSRRSTENLHSNVPIFQSKLYASAANRMTPSEIASKFLDLQ